MIQDIKPIYSVNPWKFIIWLFIISIIMLFAAFTSAYLVRRAEGNWTEFEIPVIFYISTAVLIISSLTMHLSVKAAKADQLAKLRTLITITTIGGIAFLVLQVLGWQQLQAAGVYVKGNPAESFYYVLTGVHFFHIITGLGVLLYAFYSTFKGKITAKNTTQIEVCATYWHFLDILWIYLFLFLIYFR